MVRLLVEQVAISHEIYDALLGAPFILGGR